MAHEGLKIALAASVVMCGPPMPAFAVSPGRQAAINAADAAMAEQPVVADPGVPVCASLPPTGEKIAGDMVLAAEGHAIDIENGGGGNALVKIRHAATGKLAASFYIRKLEAMTIEGVPDGEYAIQYAFGPALAADCKSFTRIIKASAIPGSDILKTETIDDADHTEVKRMSISYQINVTETSGTVRTVAIDAATFNAD
jgi:hypothetical protein